MAPADRPFVDRPPPSLAATRALARAACRHWHLPPPQLMRVGMNAIYAAGDVVVRVGCPTAPPGAAVDLARALQAAGIDVAPPARPDAVTSGDLAATAWMRLVPADDEPDWRAVGAMVARVHDLTVDALPGDYPVPPCRSFPWWQFDTLLEEVADLIDAASRAGIDRAVSAHRRWVDAPARVVCHGDVHPGNVVATASGTVLLDWDLLCTGPPGWDHAMLTRLEVWGEPTRWYDEFAAGYGASLRDDAVTASIAELRLVAATLMRLRAGRADADAMSEARRRLAYWRGDPDAPPWRAA